MLRIPLYLSYLDPTYNIRCLTTSWLYHQPGMLCSQLRCNIEGPIRRLLSQITCARSYTRASPLKVGALRVILEPPLCFQMTYNGSPCSTTCAMARPLSLAKIARRIAQSGPTISPGAHEAAQSVRSKPQIRQAQLQ